MPTLQAFSITTDKENQNPNSPYYASYHRQKLDPHHEPYIQQGGHVDDGSCEEATRSGGTPSITTYVILTK